MDDRRMAAGSSSATLRRVEHEAAFRVAMLSICDPHRNAIPAVPHSAADKIRVVNLGLTEYRERLIRPRSSLERPHWSLLDRARKAPHEATYRVAAGRKSSDEVA